ncbi:MAG: hypothetical protein HY470_00555, partial [Candidatus Ryanbacteria bacterium]|nr:hypothetical protein [Candidatus Ryanbacteria bacterium]
LLFVLDERNHTKLREHVDVFVSTAEQEIGTARRVFQADFEEKRRELEEFVGWVRQEFGADLSKNTREIYWIRMLLRILEEECLWLATVGGLNARSEAQAA